MPPVLTTTPNAGIPYGAKRARDQKIAHELVDYHRTEGEERCDACIHYTSDGGCAIVEDPIHPDGWCRLFKPPAQEAGDAEMGRIKSIKIKFQDEGAEDYIPGYSTWAGEVEHHGETQTAHVMATSATHAKEELQSQFGEYAQISNVRSVATRPPAEKRRAYADELPPGLTQDAAIALDQGSVREFDPDGRMRVTKAHISKANICPYKGSEIPGAEDLGLDPNKVYMLLRHPEELKKAAPSFNGVQLLRRHVPVDADDHRAWDIIGTTGTECEFNDPYLDNSLAIWAQDGIDEIESNRKRELSAGYHYRADMTPGNFGGKPYDGVMRDIVGNHVALVETGRAGSDVMVGDSMENLMPAAPLPSRFATIAEAAIRAALPPLKPGTKLDLRPVFDGMKQSTFNKAKVKLALDTALKGKLAKDASLENITAMLDHLESTKNPKSMDESVSGAQHRAMGAAASGQSNLGIPQSVGEEFLDKDKGKTFSDADPSANLSHFLHSKGMSEDDIRTACDIARGGARDEPAERTDMAERIAAAQGQKPSVDASAWSSDQAIGGVEGNTGGKTPGSPTGKGSLATEKAKVGGDAEKDDQFAAARSDLTDKAKNKPPGEDAMPKDMVTKQAMDAAIEKATKAVRESVLKTQREIRMALDEVRPYVGELSAGLAFDAAEDVYREALKVKDPELALDGIHPSAFRHILTKGYQHAGAREPERRSGQSLGMDEAAKQSFEERFPNAKRIGVAA